MIKVYLECDRSWQLRYEKLVGGKLVQGMVPMAGCIGLDGETRCDVQKMAEKWLDRNEPEWRTAASWIENLENK
jgi:hypothetical protein